MTNKITPEIIEKAIDWLESESYCCYALTCSLSGYPLESWNTKNKHIEQAEEFLSPLLARDNISNSGSWAIRNTMKRLPFTRKEWLLKIAQELREGKISA